MSNSMYNSPLNTIFRFSFLLFCFVVVAKDQEQAPAEYTDDSTFKKAILNSTNTYRRQHNATSLTWNTTLADFAEDWGSSCEFGHSNGPYGENLASGYPNTTTSIAAWAHERVDYDFSKGDFNKETGHFTQLVWKSTTAVGCSRKDCTDSDGGAPGWYVVCEYWPRGNVIGAFRENVQERVRGDGESEPEPEEPGGGEECMQGAQCGGVVGRVGMGSWVWVVVLGVGWSVG